MEWIPVAITVGLSVGGAAVSTYTTFRSTNAVNVEKWAKMDETMKNFRADHMSHFKTAEAANIQIERTSTQIAEHKDHDEERFDRIESMFREIRGLLNQRS